MLSQRISGTKLRRLREQRLLTVAAVADAAGCTPWNIYKIEQGKTQPSPIVFAGLKTVLDAEDSELIEESAGSAA
ncbi:helix-turn-helix domain-containing protein [Streptomyces phaeochromogenes]|uniref:helix-turn-helix domain-containing protein n=1 Tax=Streptomyces phaeochromogenes TaxID=1923 RepID=UPI0036878546